MHADIWDVWKVCQFLSIWIFNWLRWELLCFFTVELSLEIDRICANAFSTGSQHIIVSLEFP